MLLLEDEHLHGAVRIFATDLDERALARARRGEYPRSIDGDVSAERLERFFVPAGDGYRVCPSLRSLVTFARHDLCTDAPYSHLDLVSSRNLLMYLNPSTQQKVLRSFGRALRPGGFLFLGGSESIDDTAELFRTVDRSSRIYQRLDGGSSRPRPRSLRASDDALGFLAHLHTPAVVVDKNLLVRRSSPAARALFGLLPDADGRDACPSGGPLGIDRLDVLVARTLASGESLQQEVRGADDQWYTLHATPASPTSVLLELVAAPSRPWPAGVPGAEDALAELDLGVAVLDGSMRMVWANHAFLALLALDGAAVGQRLVDRWPLASEQPDLWAMLKETMTTGRPFEGQPTVDSAAARHVPFRLSARLLPAQADRAPHVLLVAERTRPG
jgi:SAM-dependent methyltransferase